MHMQFITQRQPFKKLQRIFVRTYIFVQTNSFLLRKTRIIVFQN